MMSRVLAHEGASPWISAMFYDGRGGRRGSGNTAGGRMVNEVIIQQRQGEVDESTVSSRGGKSGSGFGRGAHGGLIPHE
jgi:hypothetical protein